MANALLVLLFIRAYLEKDLNPPKEKVHKLVDAGAEHVTCAVRELRRLFLIEDLVDTLKVRYW